MEDSPALKQLWSRWWYMSVITHVLIFFPQQQGWSGDVHRDKDRPEGFLGQATIRQAFLFNSAR